MPLLLCSTHAKVAGSGDLSSSCRVPSRMKGHDVPQTSPAPARPRRAGGGGRDGTAGLGTRLKAIPTALPGAGASGVRAVGLGGAGVSHRVRTPALPAQADPELPSGFSPWSQPPRAPLSQGLWQLVGTHG